MEEVFTVVEWYNCIIATVNDVYGTPNMEFEEEMDVKLFPSERRKRYIWSETEVIVRFGPQGLNI